MTKNERQFKSGEFQFSFLTFKYWGIWFLAFILMLFAMLPWAIQWRLADFLSKIAWKSLSSRRKTTLRNLQACFPEKTPLQIEAKAKQVFVDTLTGVFEALNAWYCPNWFKSRVHIDGLENLTNNQENGVLLLGTHSTLLDAGGAACTLFFNMDVVYRPQNNPFLDFLIHRSRARVYKNQIARDNMRGLIQNLKHGHAIWYSPDQDFGLKQGVIASFFGIQAATVTAHRRLMDISKAAAVPLYFYRSGDIRNPQYHVLVEPKLENFPSGCEVSDAERVNKIIENQIRIAPTQYMWFHRRFKTRPAGEQKFY
ncbi:lauroyl acyltransferase [Acinetobacter pittii]|uniref:Lipid A biosynthesis acyltransferase n=1 Tax=Acinetobacter pittii TaxID=48296 RepID=A0A3R9RWL8_ACIPI|nr:MULTISPECIES: lauroyl acyltransferase [Acinetobacter]MDR0069691.1 lauroyl acyltransferase [Acinetobacter sp. 11520]KQE20719.1 lauroyl acyltransferase [Acinetobacter pittii]KQF43484.1 lauroyl acyltransferase [Acinetobacter pittii]KQG08893.1 lauroyl acyltransferase [Acinetobacter pittii]KRI49762.1 lauroyl acyltransferase [Acinetobacter pittii]